MFKAGGNDKALKIYTKPVPDIDVDELAIFIDTINEDKTMGAGSLAECICRYLKDK
jgi:hypothetical protein